MIHVENNILTISFPDIHPNAGVKIDLQRTLRLPDDGHKHYLPPGLGSFPLRHIEDFDLGNNNALKSRGGLIMPMFQADALWLNFDTRRIDFQDKAYPMAIKVGTGKLCAISGDPWSNTLNKDPQDYMMTPGQPWLDGYNVGNDVVRQFVAAPLGDGVTAEEQITGSADVGGIQIQVFPMKRSYYDVLNKKEPIQRIVHSRSPIFHSRFVARINKESLNIEPSFMGIAPGGTMEQEIHKDTHDLAAWDQRQTERCFVTIANAAQWISITGEAPPLSPVSANQYTKAGLPWYSYYDAESKAIEGAKALGDLKSFQKLYAEQGKRTYSEETLSGWPRIVSNLQRLVKSGSW